MRNREPKETALTRARGKDTDWPFLERFQFQAKTTCRLVIWVCCLRTPCVVYCNGLELKRLLEE